MAGVREVLGSARARVLVGALGLLGVAIVVSVLVDRAVLLDRLGERIDEELSQEVGEFSRLAGGIDPDTGEPFGDDVARVFDTFFARNVPGEDEVILGVVDGRPYKRTAAAPYPVDRLPELVTAWSSTTAPQYRTDPTPAGEFRSLVVPVTDAQGSTVAHFVVGRFPAGERAEVDEAVRVAAVVGGAVFLAAAAVAWFLAGRVLAPLRALADATDSIDEQELTTRIPVEGSGELAELTRNFNAMLDRVEDAVATQRAFLDDAGHELRTPITVVRGHLELSEPGEPFLASTRDLVLDELDRMSRIVEDLLVMAKAARPDFVVTAPVDLDDLAGGVLAKARPLADRDWVLRADSSVAELDRERITQALMNLVRNAVQHTAPGDRITVVARTIPAGVELGVVDTGEGVSEEDRDRIFDRFGRGSSVRRTRSDGAGLGLAIAAAIATAHGGELRHEHTPGGGATFLLTLPGPVSDPEPDPTVELPRVGPGDDPADRTEEVPAWPGS